VQTQITKDGSALNYYPHHIGDYLRDTAHLTPLEDGIYRRMLDVYYASEKPLPVETQWVCRLVRARTTEEQSAVDEVLRQFFSKHPDGWRNKRADNEIRKGRARVKAARTNGKSGGRPKTQRVSKNNPVGGLDVNPDQSSQKPKAKSQREDKRAARLPSTWEPDSSLAAWFSENRPDLDLSSTAAKFRDHWAAAAGKSATKHDWAAAFRNWARNEKGGTQKASPPKVDL
jgi:uncharacterized protein YdaU (DUF1376 family)